MATAAPAPKADKAALERARSKARALASLYSAPPIPVKDIAQKAGARVMLQTLGPPHDQVSALCDFKKAVIYVNALEEPVRQHYAMAHELGHFVLHRDEFDAHPERYTVLPRFGTPPTTPHEQAAEAFATELLVPRRLLDPVARTAPPAELARIFKVPLDLMERRLKNG